MPVRGVLTKIANANAFGAIDVRLRMEDACKLLAVGRA
jgi:hypothetical protein